MASSQQPLLLRFQSDGVRGPRGQYKSLQAITGLLSFAAARDKFIETNRVLAHEVQLKVVEELRKGILRPDVRTGRLEAATGAEGNLYADAQTWGIGVPNFLNKSQAKYWRTIDEGSANVWKHPFAGSIFYVKRGSAFGATIASFNADRSFAGGPFSAPGASAGGKLNAISRSTIARQLEKNGRLPRGVIELIIKREIAGQNYYDRGFKAWGGPQAALRVYANKFDQAYRGY